MKYVYPSLWHLQSPSEEASLQLALECDISPFLAKLLWNRGLREASEVRSFLADEAIDFSQFALLPDCEKAVHRLASATQNHEKVLVFGDYDVDGITSTVLLYTYLRDAGADPVYYIPTRSGEGYGLNEEAVRRFAADGVTLLVTVDSGVTALEEVELANSLGMSVVLTDHHRCRQILPNALAIVNPMRVDSVHPFSALAGVGVTYQLLCALHAHLSGLSPEDACQEITTRYIEFVAIGTVADVMPLTGENRKYVRKGLVALEHTQNIGLEALLQEIHPSNGNTKPMRFNSGAIGFLIAPRINAAGRVGSAMRAVELFLTQDRLCARNLASELCEENKRRQVTEALIYEQAAAAIEANGSAQTDLFLVEGNERWHQGVVGIVASRLCEQYHRPCMLFSYPEGPDGPAKGSGRSIRGLNLVEALASCEDLLLKYGGHELAAGVMIQGENIPLLRERLNAYARENLKPEDLISSREIDLALTPEDVTLENAQAVMSLEPFGMKNAKPLFLLRDALVETLHPIGDGKHTRLSVQINGSSFQVICFNRSFENLCVLRGETMDLCCTLDINNYLDKTTAQLSLKDLRPGKALQELLASELALYTAFCESKGNPPEVPTRREFETVFRQLKGVCKAPQVDLFFFSRKLAYPLSKLLLVLDIFEEAGLIRRFSPAADTFAHISLLPQNSTKASLESTPTYQKLTAKG